MTEGLDAELREARERVDPIPSREDHRDPLGQESSGDEGQHACRRPVEPLGVVDDAQERLLLGSFRQ